MPGFSRFGAHGCQAIEQPWRDPHPFDADAVNQVSLPMQPMRGVLRSALEIVEDGDDLFASDQHELAGVLVLKARTLPIIRAQLEVQRPHHLDELAHLCLSSALEAEAASSPRLLQEA
jgi:hypothetical protein